MASDSRKQRGTGTPQRSAIAKGRSVRQQIAKGSWRPGTMLAPVPPVLVSCGGNGKFRPNIITVAWAGTVCSEPPMLSVSIRPQRYSHEIISATHEFVVNLTTAAMARAVDWCGVKSGRDVDKFEGAHLTPFPSEQIGAPGIAESPVNMECRVRKVLSLGSHDMFIAEIVAVHISEELLDRRGKLRLENAGLLAYSHGEYYSLGKRLGYFGYSVRKK